MAVFRAERYEAVEVIGTKGEGRGEKIGWAMIVKHEDGSLRETVWEDNPNLITSIKSSQSRAWTELADKIAALPEREGF